jgi:hypothetical protein
MKLFECGVCDQTLYFENTACEKCHHRLGYVPQDRNLAALEQAADGPLGTWHVAGQTARRYRFCDNAQFDACNWLVEADSTDRFCAACRHNSLIPDLSSELNRQLWRGMELAKRRLFYTLMELKLPLITRDEDPHEGLAFEFLADTSPTQKVLTGHDEGKITINIAEADDAERERRRTSMHEPYRTLLGHFRHEIGHWYWDRLVRDHAAVEPFRAVFGDERQDYNEALQRHYANGAPPDWRERFVSAYATSHPWEDFAETWAHYLHIVDTLETANEFGINVHPRHIHDAEALSTDIDFEPQYATSIDPLIQAWLPLTFAVNSLNRSMGLSDLYPFVLSQTVVTKLGFVHDLVHGTIGPETRSRPEVARNAHPPVQTGE